MLGVTYRGKLSGMTKHTKNYPPGKFGWVDYLPYPPTCTSIEFTSFSLQKWIRIVISEKSFALKSGNSSIVRKGNSKGIK